MGEPSREIERKFLVNPRAWQNRAPGVRFRQGYLSTDPDRTVRVRLEGDVGKLTIKGRKVGATAIEYEYDVPADDVEQLLATLCQQPILEKTRHTESGPDGMEWVVDVFHGDNQGLVVAEIELDAEDQPFEKPEWVGAEVTEDPAYSNARLSQRPFGSWEQG